MTLLLHRCVLSVVALFLLLSSSASGQDDGKFYYWMTPAQNKRAFTPTESFVIEVNAAQAAQIDASLRGGSVTSFQGRVAAGAVSYNRDYYAAGHPVWNWHVSLVEEIASNAAGLACECPFLVANPSEIARDPEEWIAREGDRYSPRYYWAVGRINPATGALLANVSNRGMTGMGERALITGLIITGGEPRNVVVRALGPSLSAGGVRQPAGNPTIAVYRGDVLIASNDDWEKDSRSRSLQTSYPGLVPTDDKEAALLLTLLPGAYTLHGLNNDGAEGVALLEAYDVDSALE